MGSFIGQNNGVVGVLNIKQFDRMAPPREDPTGKLTQHMGNLRGQGKYDTDKFTAIARNLAVLMRALLPQRKPNDTLVFIDVHVALVAVVLYRGWRRIGVW